MMNCGIVPLAAIAVFCLVIFAAGMRAQAKDVSDAPDNRYKYEISLVYTMDECVYCDQLEAYMQRHGFTTHVTYVTEQPQAVDYFPMVRYTDGFFDNGQRVKSGQCKLPKKPIERIHLKKPN